jgi:hypothetical protein
MTKIENSNYNKNSNQYYEEKIKSSNQNARVIN